MALSNPLTKFPTSVTPPGSANTSSPNRPLAKAIPIVKYTAVGSIAHAPHTQLTPVASKANFKSPALNVAKSINKR